MTEDTGYNGWTNYETWNLALWLSNDEGSYDYWRERSQDAYDNAEKDDTFTRKERAALDLADALKDEIEEGAPEVTGFYADILNAAISSINWYEITSHWMDDVDEEDEETEDTNGR